ncbi:MAG: bifunctional alpha/beta hydrolase/OsmC family protein [Bacteroidota bacterium]
MPFKKLTFTNRRGEQLAARLDLPDGAPPTACALFAHCFTCSKNLRAVGIIDKALNEAGIAVLRFDFTGLGESEGDFADTSFSSNIDDLVDAAAFLEAEYEAPMLLIGHSLGGAAVLQAAHQLPSVRAVATIGAPFDPQHVSHLFESDRAAIERDGVAQVRIGGRPFTIKRAFLDDLETHQVERRIKTLRRALLIFHAPGDATVEVENARLIYDAARHPKSFVSLDGADHLLSRPADAEYVGQVLAAWGRKYLPVGKTTSVNVGSDATAAPVDGVTVTIGTSGFKSEVRAGRHRFIADEPPSIPGGTDEGPTPYDLLAAALGTCTAMTLRMYADHKGWPLEGVAVHLKSATIHAADCVHCLTEDPEAKVFQITRTLTLTGPLDAKQRQRLKEIADRCPVHRTLEAEIDVVTELA